MNTKRFVREKIDSAHYGHLTGLIDHVITFLTAEKQTLEARGWSKIAVCQDSYGEPYFMGSRLETDEEFKARLESANTGPT